METFYAWLTGHFGVRMSRTKPAHPMDFNKGSVSMGRGAFKIVFGFLPKEGELHRVETTALEDTFDGDDENPADGGQRAVVPGGAA